MSDLHRFIGGMRAGGRNASSPLAEMTINQSGVITVQLRTRLQRTLYGRWLPTTVFGPMDDPSAENIKGGLLGSDGVRVRAEDRTSVVFWTPVPREVLTALGEHGIKTVWHEHPPKVWIRG